VSAKPKSWNINPAYLSPADRALWRGLVRAWFLTEGGGLPYDWITRTPSDSITLGSGGWAASALGKGVEFDGTATYIDTGWVPPTMNAGTWAAVVIHANDSASDRHIFRTDATGGNGTFLGNVANGGTLEFYIRDSSTGQWRLATGPYATFPKDKPTVVAGRWDTSFLDGGTNKVECWQDGLLGTPATALNGGPSGFELWIGQRKNGSQYWMGHIGAFVVWDHALSMNEMVRLTQSPADFYGLIADVWSGSLGLPSGTVWNESLTEAFSLADVPSVVTEFAPSLTEVLQLADVPSVAAEFNAALVEGVGLADVPVGVLVFTESLVEAFSLGDAPTEQKFSPQYARPDEDIGVTVWTTQSGGTTGLYLTIDETTPNDSDYVRSETDPVTSTYEVGLSPVTDPSVQGGHQWSYRYRKTGSVQVDLKVRLQAADTVIKTITHTNIGTSWVTNEYLMTSAEVDSFRSAGGYADPRIEFEANAP
jgi:hypothetical protein